MPFFLRDGLQFHYLVYKNLALYTKASILLILWIHCSAGMLALGSLSQFAHRDDVG